MTEALTRIQADLIREVRRLCLKTHGKEHVSGWEFALFQACLGKAMLPTVTYGDMALLLRLFIDSGGWVMRVDGVDKFIPRSEWGLVVRASATSAPILGEKSDV